MLCGLLCEPCGSPSMCSFNREETNFSSGTHLQLTLSLGQSGRVQRLILEQENIFYRQPEDPGDAEGKARDGLYRPF